MKRLTQLWRGRRPLPGTLCDETPQTLVADGPAAKPWPDAIDRASCARCGVMAYLVPTEGGGMRWEHGANVLDGHEPVVRLLPGADAEQPADLSITFVAEVGVDELTGWHDRAVHRPPTGRPAVVELDNRTAAFTPDPAALARRSAAQLAGEVIELREQLAEVTAERDEEARINADLRKTIDGQRRRIHGLELTVRSLGNDKALLEIRLQRAEADTQAHAQAADAHSAHSAALIEQITETVPMPRVRSLHPHDHGDDLVAPWPTPTP